MANVFFKLNVTINVLSIHCGLTEFNEINKFKVKDAKFFKANLIIIISLYIHIIKSIHPNIKKAINYFFCLILSRILNKVFVSIGFEICPFIPISLAF